MQSAGLAAMRAIQVHRFGSSKLMKLVTDAPLPTIGDNQVLVKIMCSGVNPVDTYIRDGQYGVLPELPYIPGKDGAGVVDKVGPAVTRFKAGDRVFVTQSGRFGTLAEYAAVEQRNVFPLDQRLSFAEGAALPVPYFTAYRALYLKGGLLPGQRVLVHGASGAVGQATVQLGAASGAVVVGTVGTAEGEAVVKECGAVAVYNHRQKDYLEVLAREQSDRFDVIVEMLANANLGSDLALLKPRGTVVVVGCRGEVTINPRLMMMPESSVVGCALGASSEEEWVLTGRAIARAVETGTARPRVSRQYPLEKVAQAHDDVMSGESTLGKLVVDVAN